jgi:dipeptidyl aminopeptidase/acylaminoacyl peptidase
MGTAGIKERPTATKTATQTGTGRPFRPADLLKQVMIQGLAVAPDGSAIVYSRRTIENGKYRRRLWLTTFRAARPEPLTTADANDSRPRFSPDGRALLFLSDRSGRPQPWVLPLGGGEARQVVDLPGAVSVAEWSPDGKRLLLIGSSGEKRFLVGKEDDPVARRIRDYTWRFDGAGYRDEFNSVWVVGAAGGAPRRLTAPSYDVSDARWSPDGSSIAFLADLSETAGLEEAQALWSLPSKLTTGAQPSLLASLEGAIFGLAWAPEQRIAFAGIDHPHAPGWASVGLYLVEGSGARRVPANNAVSLGNTTYGDLIDPETSWIPSLAWSDEEHLLGLVTQKGSVYPYRFGLDGSAERLASGDMNCTSIAGGAGKVAVVASIDGPADVWAVEDGRLRRLTSDGSRWYGPFRRTVEHFEIQRPDNGTLDVWLLRGRGAKQPGPLVLDVHGGPNAAFGPVPWLEMVALADAGFHVAWSNPRGSTSYGEDHARAIDGRWGTADADDVLRVVEWAVDLSVADRGQIGVVGLSYGGFMTNWLLGHHPGVFAAAVSENPVTDMLGEYGSSDFGVGIGREAVGYEKPWENLNAFLERSPFTSIHRSHAPLLLLQSEQDLRCPPGQTEIVFAILRSLGREVEMVRYPGESHILFMIGRPDRRVDRMERIVGWFEKHLGART